MEGGAARRVGPVDGLEKRLDELMMSANWGASLRSAIRAAETKRCKTEGRMEIRGENSDWLDLSPPCGCRLLEGSSGVEVWSRGGVANACTPATELFVSCNNCIGYWNIYEYFCSVKLLHQQQRICAIFCSCNILWKNDDKLLVTTLITGTLDGLNA